MKIEFDWLYLRKPIIASALVSLVSISIALIAMLYNQHYQRANQQANLQIKRLYEEIKRNRQEGRMIASKWNSFQALAISGVIGHESRLQWINAFQQRAKQLRLGIAQYKIEPQAELKHPSLSHPLAQLFQSKMKIHAQLLHEVDLLSLLHAFDSVPGQYDVSACSIIRTGHKLQLNSLQANLIVNCSINWYTLKPDVIPTEVARQ